MKRSVYAGCFVWAPRRRVLCQLRDNKPGIAFPGYWTCSPGGRVGKREQPRRAVLRELDEEFGIRVKNLKKIKAHVESAADFAGVYHFFSAKLASKESHIECREGQKAVLFPISKALKLKQHPLSLQVLKEII